MIEWNEYRKRNILIEKIGILLIVIIIFGGIIADIIVARGIVFHEIEDINSFSLTLLQIQSSVGTVTIALVALISGNISDSYMGISVSDYYLNLRPYILKQKIIIILSLVLLIAGVGSHILGAYNSVLGLFFMTVVLVIISVYEIYSLFSGKRLLQKEIESYISFIMESNKAYRKKSDLCECFIKDWEESIGNQDTAEYDRYVEILCNHIMTLLNAETEDKVKDVEKLCTSAVETFLKSEKTTVKKRAVQLLDRLYERMWVYIAYNNDKVTNWSANYTLIRNLQLDFQEAINEIPVETVEKIINWNYLADNIERVAFWTNNQYRDKKISELESVNYISRYWGIYLRKQRQKGNMINEKYWGDPFENLYLTSADNIPKAFTEDFLFHKVEMYFNYFYGLINNGLGCIIKESLYLRGMSLIHSIQNRYEAIFYLSIQCYLYYLTERESEDCVTSCIRPLSAAVRAAFSGQTGPY